jgi:NAD(P)H-hydrate epimerase
MARMLERRGVDCDLTFLSSTDGIDGDAGANLRVAERLDLDYRDFGDLEPDAVERKLRKLPDCDLWVDALLGTGGTGDVRGRYVPAVEFLRDREPVFAVDIPSGVQGETGQIMGVAVDADVTATFGGVKLGQAIYPGRQLCGDLHAVEIGIPDQVREKVDSTARWLDAAWASGTLSARPAVYHKGESGRMLAVAGSHEKTGAALLAARGALAGGGGLITVGTTAEVVERVAPAIHEVMAAELVDTEKNSEVTDRLGDVIDGIDVVAAAPRRGPQPRARDAVRSGHRGEADSIVLDADALNIAADEIRDGRLAEAAEKANVVLTPHPVEMSRLCGCDIPRILEAPVECASNYARETGAIVVLKMAATVVAAPDGRLGINRSGNPGMATGGMGDVLTGVVAARLAESTGDPFVDASLAVWAHGAAGDLAAADRGERGLRATDLPERLPEIWSRIEST